MKYLKGHLTHNYPGPKATVCVTACVPRIGHSSHSKKKYFHKLENFKFAFILINKNLFKI